MLKQMMLVILMVFLLLGTGCAPKQEEDLSAQPETTEPAQEEKTPAPDFTVYDLEGEPVKLSDFRGQPVVLNFWASWCGPCKNEMPDFQAAFEKYGDRVAFMMVNLTDNTTETVETASALIADLGYTFPVYYDTTEAASILYRVSSIPVTFFVDAQGDIVAYGTGSMALETVEKGIGMILEEPI